MRKRLYTLLGMFLLFALLTASIAAAESYTGLIHNGSTMIPVRGVFQSMGAHVDWDPSTKKITIKKNQLQTELHVNSKQASVNGNMLTLDVAPFVRNGVTYLPLRFIAESIGAEVKWNPSTKIAQIIYEGKVIQVTITQSTQVSNAKITSFFKKINGIQVTGVMIPANAGYKAKMAIANNQLGTTQSLAQMAQSNQALVAVNGTYFGAYGGHPDPWNQVIQAGKVIHIGNTGSTFGFTEDGEVKLEKLRISVKGSTNGSFAYPNNWYAYNFNHWPTKNGNFAYIFTPEWGKTLGFTYGKNIVVADGVVTKISSGVDVNIPTNGYILSLHGSEKVLENRFKVGAKVDCQVSFTNHQGKAVDWSDVTTAVGAGPSLVKDGKIIVDAASEGFTEAKILSQSNSRSAIGAKANGDIILVHATTNIHTLAQIMKSLGAVQAMNLDGGASSGIYFNGKYLVKPGRSLSNALIFTK